MHEPVQPLGLLADGLEQLPARARVEAAGSRLEQALAAPVIAASGVRRSCETELSSELRRRSVSISHLRPLRPPRPGWPRSSASGRLAGEASRAGAAARGRRSRAAVARPHPSTPTRALAMRAAAGTAPRAPGSVSVPSPAGLPVLEDPLGDAAARSRRHRRTASGRDSGARRPLLVGQQAATTWPRNDLGRRAARRSRSELVDAARAGQLAAHRVERRRAPLALPRRLRLGAERTVSALITSADHEHHGERDEVLGVRRPRT